MQLPVTCTSVLQVASDSVQVSPLVEEVRIASATLPDVKLGQKVQLLDYQGPSCSLAAHVSVTAACLTMIWLPFVSGSLS